MIYLLAIVALSMLAVVGYQIYSVVKNDQQKIDAEREDEPSVFDTAETYRREQSDFTNFEWQSTATAEEPIDYTMAGTTETQVVEVKEEKPKKKKSYYKKKEKKSNGEKSAPKMKAADKKGKKKGGKDDLLLS
jgi:nitrogen fixation-related uncharacterized protein